MPTFDLRIAGIILAASLAGPAGADGGHSEGTGHGGGHMMDSLRDQHRGHAHGHDFEAMETMDREELERMMGLMQDIGLALPPMDPARGREVFVRTGCVVCHSVNGVGGEIGPAMDADLMPSPMNTFEFAARMWRGAAPMVMMQEQLFGDVISLTGQDLADIIAFVHDEDEQRKLTGSQIPPEFRDLMGQ